MHEMDDRESVAWLRRFFNGIFIQKMEKNRQKSRKVTDFFRTILKWRILLMTVERDNYEKI